MKPEEKNKKKLILGALIIISVLVWGRSLAPVKKKFRSISRKSRTSAAQAMQKRKAPRTAVKEWGRNPFTAAAGSESNVPGLRLGGIISDANGRYALINDQIAYTGDAIGGYTVVSIEEGRVILNNGLKDLELKLE